MAAEDERKQQAGVQTVTIGVRLASDRLDAFDAALARYGAESRSEALRRLIFNVAGYFAPDGSLSEEVRRMGVELSKLGTNVNQIARRLNEQRKTGGPHRLP